METTPTIWENGVLREFAIALSDWTDNRFVTKEDISTHAIFLMYLVNLSDAYGWEYLGHSWRERANLGCLVVKAKMGGAQYVAFTSAQTPTHGMRIFLRKMEEERVEWVEDRYA